jgi:PAS domain S-box-containing protein
MNIIANARPGGGSEQAARHARGIERSDHFVQLYEQDSFLVEAVSHLIAEGLDAGGGGVVIATKPHREGIDHELRRRGLDPDSLIQSGRYVALDAAETLSRLIVNGWPDRTRFDDIIGSTIRSAFERSSHRQVQAFGEMVALLWAQGKRDVALRLEELWNVLTKKLPVSLCCAYPLDLLSNDAEGADFNKVCTEHSRVIPAESYTALRNPDDRLRLVSRLQLRAKVLEAKTANRRTAGQSLQLCERELTDFLENAAEGVHQLGPDGKILWANRSQLKLLGYRAEEYVGRRVADFYVQPELFDKFWRTLMSDGIIHDFATDLRCKDGLARHVFINSSGLWQDGKFLYTRCFIRDVTERVQLENELRKKVAELAEADRRKNEFLAMLGHELRNPRGAVSTAAQVLEWTDSDLQATRARTILIRQTAHLARIVDDLLDVARVTSGRIALSKQPTNLAECITECVTTLRCARRLDDGEVRVELEPVWVDGDPARLTQIATNLLLNAVKYTPEPRKIVVRAKAENGHVDFQVEDNGVGIPADFLPRVFDLFTKGAAGADSQGGLGIGLTLVRRLVELHDGTVTAASEGSGRGSVFTVRLPRIAAPQSTAVVANAAANPVAPRRILIIEDQDDARESLSATLELLGHHTFESRGGQGSVELALELQPDVALIDIGLPGLNGYELARQIRSAPAGRNMLLIALTGYGQADDRRRALESGFEMHLVKPLDLDHLGEILSATRRPGSNAFLS